MVKLFLLSRKKSSLYTQYKIKIVPLYITVYITLTNLLVFQLKLSAKSFETCLSRINSVGAYFKLVARMQIKLLLNLNNVTHSRIHTYYYHTPMPNFLTTLRETTACPEIHSFHTQCIAYYLSTN